MSEILNLSNDISLTKDILIRSASSVGGYTRTQRGGPTLFKIEANLPLLNETDHLKVQKELQSIDEGISFLTGQLPQKALLTPWRGDIVDGGSGITVDTVNSTGSVVVLTGVAATTQTIVDNFDGTYSPQVNYGSYVRAGDFIQFSNSTKVFQIKQDNISDASGNLTINLNQGVIVDLLSNTTYVTGNNVQFKLQLLSQPIVTAVPQSATTNLYSYNTFTFKETL